VLCVAVATAGIRPSSPGRTPRSSDRAAYLAALPVIFMANGLLAVALRWLGGAGEEAGRQAEQHGRLLLSVSYSTIAATAWLDALVTRRRIASPKATALLGLLAGAGSIGGLGILSLCSSSGMAFCISGISQMLAVALISVLAFRERPTASWVATIVLGVVSVLLAGLAAPAGP